MLVVEEFQVRVLVDFVVVGLVVVELVVVEGCRGFQEAHLLELAQYCWSLLVVVVELELVEMVELEEEQ